METNATDKDTRPAAYAGFWQRFLAIFLDTLVLSGITYGLAVAMTPPFPTASGQADFIFKPDDPPVLLYKLLSALTWWLYFSLSESSSWQATFGKRLLGLQVTDLEGNRINFYRATLRHFSKLLSAGTMFVGFLMAAFSSRKQALHDMVAGTLVLQKKAVFLPSPEEQPAPGNLR